MLRGITVSELTPGEFLAKVHPLASIYADAMRAEQRLLPGRREPRKP